MEKLSKMQKRVYEYIVQSIQENGYAPSVREIGEALVVLAVRLIRQQALVVIARLVFPVASFSSSLRKFFILQSQSRKPTIV